MSEKLLNSVEKSAKHNASVPAKVYVCKGWCGQMTRSSNQPLEKFPGTVSRVRGGMCWKCAARADAEAAEAVSSLPDPEAAAEAQIRDYRYTLAGFMRRRQEREQESIHKILRARRGKLSA